MSFVLNEASLSKLAGVHPQLVAVVIRATALSSLKFIVTEGVRSRERQRKLVAMGASKTMNSKHLTQPDGYAHAVDLAAWLDLDEDESVDGGEIRWDWPLYAKIATAMKAAAGELRTPIEWGGDWRRFKDGPHFQLSEPV